MRWLQQPRSQQHTVSYEMLILGYEHAISTFDMATATSLLQELEERQQTENWMQQEELAAMVNIYERTKAYEIIALGGDLNTVKEILGKQLTRHHVPSIWEGLPMTYNSFEYKLLRTNLASKGKFPNLKEVSNITQLFQDTNFNTLYVTAFITGIAAEIYYERDQLEECQNELEIAIGLSHQYQDPSLFVPMYLFRPYVFIESKNLRTAKSIKHSPCHAVSGIRRCF